MPSNKGLKLLCQRLVDNQFDHIHDAELALEQFEQLATPAMVLSLLEQVAPRHEMSATEDVARTAQPDVSVFAITKDLTSQG